MPDPEVQWIPDESTQAIPFRTRVIGIVVFAAIFLAIGVAIGRLTAGIPASTRSEAIRRPSAEKPTQPAIETPSLDNEAPAQKPGPPPTPEADQTTTPAVVLNPSSADKGPDREDLGARGRGVRQHMIESVRREKRERHGADDQREVLSRPARDYQSLREYMFSR